MKTSKRFEWALGAIFVALWLASWLWQNPGALGGRIGAQDRARFLAGVEKLPFPPQDRAEMVKRLGAWIDSDDGKPVYMLNLMRFYPELNRFPGSLAFQGTPQQSNAIYESTAIPMLFKLGGYPVYAGTMRAKNILEYKPELDDWSRLLVVRYPSRRAFMELVSDPAYAKVAPYKLMALSVTLSPTTSEMVIPELSLLAGAVLLIAFLAIGWARAARRTTH